MDKTTYDCFITKEDTNNTITNQLLSNVNELPSECCFIVHLEYIHYCKLLVNSSPHQNRQTVHSFSSVDSYLVPSQVLLEDTPRLLSYMLSQYHAPESYINSMALVVVDFVKEMLIDNNVPENRANSNRIVLPFSLHVVAVTPFTDVGEFERVLKEIRMAGIGSILKKVDIESLTKSGSAIDKCTICLEGYDYKGKEIVSTPCSHVYHKNCIVQWFEKSRFCPLCRYDIS